MSWSSCPFCSRQVLSIELERHANEHFEEEDLVQLANHYQDEDVALDDAASTASHVLAEVPKQAVGLMGLLKNCLESDGGMGMAMVCGHVDHFGSVEFEDVGWGCGWRNIQMLSSHLLAQRQEAREALFGGGGSVPDILSLQRWLEIAWEKGFDRAGSNDFHHKIYGKRTWIGTTECAALLRSFGLRARIVDFSSQTQTTCKGAKRTHVTTGPMDRYLNTPAAAAASSTSNHNKSIRPQMVKGHQLLANWVWSYFSDNNNNVPATASTNRVVVTHKPPLYFQHDGHSRTIVGIQLKTLPNGMQQHNLLILDPAHKTEVLETCLSKKVGWQRYIKRGVHTLKKPDYQMCYVDPGIATGPEMEKLKTLDSTRFQF